MEVVRDGGGDTGEDRGCDSGGMGREVVFIGVNSGIWLGTWIAMGPLLV